MTSEAKTYNDYIREFYQKYRDQFDNAERVYDLADHLNYLYSVGGFDKVRAWFRPSASEEYRADCMNLVNPDIF